MKHLLLIFITSMLIGCITSMLLLGCRTHKTTSALEVKSIDSVMTVTIDTARHFKVTNTNDILTDKSQFKVTETIEETITDTTTQVKRVIKRVIENNNNILNETQTIEVNDSTKALTQISKQVNDTDVNSKVIEESESPLKKGIGLIMALLLLYVFYLMFKGL